MPITKKSRIVVLLSAIVIVVLLLMTSNISFFTLAATDYNTGIPLSDLNNLVTIHSWDDVWSGNNAPGTGWPHKELIADTKYVTSFTGSSGDKALSEKIAIQGNLYENSWVEINIPDKAYYRVWIKEGGRDWAKIVDLNVVDTRIVKLTGDVGWKTCNYNPVGGTGQRIDLPAIQLEIVGSHVGALKVEMVVHFYSSYPWGGTWDKVMSTDYCYLVSGNGQINVAGHQRTDVVMFENGDTVPIQISADYSGPTIGETGRWQLWAFPQDGRPGMMLKEWTYDYFRETYNWKLPANAWVRGTSDSKWRLELKNTLFSQDAIMVNTIDVKANAPPTPSMTYMPNPPKLGEQITVVLSGKINPLTNESIQYFWLRCVYIDTNQQFIYTKVTSTGDSGTFKFTPPRAGKFKLQAWTHDVAGRETEKPAEATVDVYQGNKPVPPLPGPDLALWLVIAIIAIAAIGVTTFLYQSRKKGGGKIKFKLPKFNFKWRKKR